MDWPMEFASTIAALSRGLDFTELKPICELSGKSGARTYLCLPESNIGRPAAVIAKVGREAVLDADLHGLRLAQSMFRDAGEMLNGYVRSDGIVAIPLKIVSDNVTHFDEWYLSADPIKVSEVVSELFIDVLRLGELTLSAVNENAFAQYVIHNPKVFNQALSELGRSGQELFAWWLHAEVTDQYGTVRRLAHGDLHSRNILVAAPVGRPYVIDFGASGIHHFPRDLAKFERDIWLRLFRPTESDRVAACEELAAALDVTSRVDSEVLKATEVLQQLRSLAARFVSAETSVDHEYDVALLAQFMFAAANRDEPDSVRQAALVRALAYRSRVEERRPELRLHPDDVRRPVRRASLSRLAYSFLRMDQLPGGGWGRSVASWMETLWVGDRGTITRNPNMRTTGGTDVTCANVVHLVRFLQRTLSLRDTADLLLDNEAVLLAGESIVARKSMLGGVSSLSATRALSDVTLRHTLMAVLALLYDEIGHQGGHSRPDVVNEMASYLVTYLPRWNADTSHLFGSCMASAKLRELLDTDACSSITEETRTRLRDALDGALPAMLSALHVENPREQLRPAPPPDVKLGPPFFWPYSGFWRMERSSFLMYVRFGIQEDGEKFLTYPDQRLGRRLAACFHALLADIAVPFDPAKAEASLVYYHSHRDPEAHAQRDWGLSAELASLLRVPAVGSLLQASGTDDMATLESKREALETALVDTFDTYAGFPEIFHHTHAASFAWVLDVLEDSTPSAIGLRNIDDDIRELRTYGTTERALDRFLDHVLAAAGAGVGDVDKHSLVRFLVAKLEAGRHIPVGPAWDKVLSEVDTISWYAGNHAAAFAERTRDKELRMAPEIIRRATDSAGVGNRRALDLGCGPGRHAAMLASIGLEVDLVDLSEDMLRISAERIGVPQPAPSDMRKPTFQPASFSVVVAAESVIHIPKSELPQLISDIHRLLLPGGILYASFQVGNHALVTIDGRFYEYYPDDAELSELLSRAGLKPKYVFPWPVEPYEFDLYPSSSAWTWTDFYCVKVND